MIRKYEIDESKLVCRSNGTIDWRGSFPQLVSETSSEWARRRHDLASHLAYVRRSPERVKAATKNADDWKKRNADKHQAWTDRYVIENRGQVLFNAARLRALKKNLDLDITREWVQQRIDTGVCEVTNLPFLIQKGRTPFAPSIDRTDPQKGYTRCIFSRRLRRLTESRRYDCS